LDLLVAELRQTPVPRGRGYERQNEACSLLLLATRAVRTRAVDAPAAVTRLDSLLSTGPHIDEAWGWFPIATARLWAELGRPASAARAAAMRFYMLPTPWPYLAEQLRLEARYALAAGDSARAARALAHHIALRDGTESALRPAVDSARALLARLPRPSR
jgi:hypothetical protein